jgi:hypothetical protein
MPLAQIHGLLPGWIAQLVGRAGGRRSCRAFLALPDSEYITGQLLAVDGGYLAQGLPG